MRSNFIAIPIPLRTVTRARRDYNARGSRPTSEVRIEMADYSRWLAQREPSGSEAQRAHSERAQRLAQLADQPKGKAACDGAGREDLELRVILLVLVGPIDGARGRSDAGQHGQSQKCSENYLLDGTPYANNTTLPRLATDHAAIA